MLLLREIVSENPVGKDNHDEPVVLTEERTVPDNCEFVFESVNGLSPALEANGRLIWIGVSEIKRLPQQLLRRHGQQNGQKNVEKGPSQR